MESSFSSLIDSSFGSLIKSPLSSSLIMSPSGSIMIGSLKTLLERFVESANRGFWMLLFSNFHPQIIDISESLLKIISK